MDTRDEPRDSFLDEDGPWFRYRAAAVILRDGCVLVARNDVESHAYSIGGGVHHGESAADAVRREVWEKDGVRLDVERLLFIHENVFTESASPSLAGRRCHELTLYFLMRDDPALQAGDMGSTTLGGLRCHPTFFACALDDLPDHPLLVTTREWRLWLPSVTALRAPGAAGVHPPGCGQGLDRLRP